MSVLTFTECLLCKEVTTVLDSENSKPYLKYVYLTFFDKNENALQRFQLKNVNGNLCALCSHQLVIAHKVKESYETLCKENSVKIKSPETCFLCDQKGVDLICTDQNPNDFCKKVASFMDVSSCPISFKQSMVCFDCIFYLDIWYKIYSYVHKQCQLNIEGNIISSTPTKAQKKVHFDTDDTIIEINGCGETLITKESSSIRRRINPSKLKSVPMKKAGPLSSKKNKPHTVPVKRILKKQLGHLKSIRQSCRRKSLLPTVLENHKLYLDIPYVLLNRKQISQKKEKLKRLERRHGSESPDIIDLMDSEDEDSKPSTQVKTILRIRKSLNSSNIQSATEYTCNICDRNVSSLSEYKKHVLWHEKPERPVINVVRSNFLNDSGTFNLEDTVQRNEGEVDSSERNGEVLDVANVDKVDYDSSKVGFQENGISDTSNNTNVANKSTILEASMSVEEIQKIVGGLINDKVATHTEANKNQDSVNNSQENESEMKDPNNSGIGDIENSRSDSTIVNGEGHIRNVKIQDDNETRDLQDSNNIEHNEKNRFFENNKQDFEITVGGDVDSSGIKLVVLEGSLKNVNTVVNNSLHTLNDARDKSYEELTEVHPAPIKKRSYHEANVDENKITVEYVDDNIHKTKSTKVENIEMKLLGEDFIHNIEKCEENVI